MLKKAKKFLKDLGPSIVTGAADDDPSGIATYTQTGAQFGYGQLWVTLFILPLMTTIQETCARIGAVTGKGLTAVIKTHYSKKILYFAVALIFVANTINIGADIGAMAAAAQLLVPLNFATLAISFAALILILEIFISYKIYSKILKWFSLALFAYLATAILVQMPWAEVLKATFIPHIELNYQFFFVITGVLGATISPYMFFWGASEEVEEEKKNHMIVNGTAHVTPRFINRLKVENFIGMFASQITAWSIIVVAATVLHNNGLTDIKTVADAAEALEPIVQTFPGAGIIAKYIFALGVIGLGMLAVPVLSCSASYAISEAIGWKEGLSQKFKKAHGFYGVIIIATLIGLLMNLIGIDPIQALVFTAVINGVISVPLIFIIHRISRNEKIMGRYKNNTSTNTLLWILFSVMTLSVIAMLMTFII